jgi:hypothetical protein
MKYTNTHGFNVYMGCTIVSGYIVHGRRYAEEGWEVARPILVQRDADELLELCPLTACCATLVAEYAFEQEWFCVQAYEEDTVGHWTPPPPPPTRRSPRFHALDATTPPRRSLRRSGTANPKYTHNTLSIYITHENVHYML